MSTRPGDENNKLLGLEVIRFISALSVLIYHYGHFVFIANKPAPFVKNQQPFYAILKLFYEGGYYGVQVFWCISGFIFFWKYRNGIAGGIVGPKKFFVLRLSRLYPLHMGTLILVATLQTIYFWQHGYHFVYSHNDTQHFLLQLFLASNWGMQQGDSFNGPIWSISVEVLVYIVFFCMLRYVGKNALLSLAVLVACLTVKFYNVANPIIDCLAFFYAGGLSAMAHARARRVNSKRAVDCSILLILAVALSCILGTKAYWLPGFPFCFLVTFIPVLLFVAARGFSVNPRVQTAIEAAGNMTYSSYLIHFPIQMITVIGFASAGMAIPYYSRVFFLTFIAATLVTSYYIYRFFEMPSQAAIRTKLFVTNPSEGSKARGAV